MKNKRTILKSISWRKVTSLPVLIVASLLIIGGGVVPRVLADSYEAKIKALEQENSNNRNVVSQLAEQAASYQDAISILQAQISQLQVQINDNVARQTDLQQKIDENQRELDRQRKILGENIKVMYVEGQITTIEMLATSKNLSDFVDKEEYRNAVERKIQDTLQKITKLQNEQKEQKVQLDRLLTEQKNQQNQISQAKAEQSRLLSYNQQQQASYNQKTKENQSRIAELRRQQAIENARLSGGKVVGGKACDSGNGDTYPVSAPNAYGSRWGCSYPIDNTIDNWGMYNRECVSYTAWKVHESGRYMPYWGGRGNAKNWDDNARAAGIPVDTSPRSGDVAIKNSGTYGHALYVEHVYGDGSILVSDYNQQFDGAYRRYTISASAVSANNLQFIHF